MSLRRWLRLDTQRGCFDPPLWPAFIYEIIQIRRALLPDEPADLDRTGPQGGIGLKTGWSSIKSDCWVGLLEVIFKLYAVRTVQSA